MAVRGHDAGECPAVVAHGWNVDYSARLVVSVSTAFGCGKRLVSWPGRARCWVLRERELPSLETGFVGRRVSVCRGLRVVA
jgi:hypothetical protein